MSISSARVASSPSPRRQLDPASSQAELTQVTHTEDAAGIVV